MKRIKRVLWSVVGFLILVLPSHTQASHDQLECESRFAPTQVKVVSNPGLHIATVDFAGGGGLPPGSFDPTPLLATTVTVSGGAQGVGARSCLIAYFSAMSQPNDNHIVFQVRVDGVPMNGHNPNFRGFGTPAVSDPVEVVQPTFPTGTVRMTTYHFFATMEPGEHTVEVLFAGCCSGTTGIHRADVHSAVLTLLHR